jgi:hypothetical protein
MMQGRHYEVIEDVANILRLGESEGPASVVTDDGAIEKPRNGIEVCNFEAGSERRRS